MFSLVLETYFCGWRTGHTGIPAVVMIERCVDEKIRCPPSFAAANRRATSADRFSESPNCMAGSMRLELREEVKVRGCAGRSDNEGGDGWHQKVRIQYPTIETTSVSLL
jgi:hypothetical protein